MPNIATPKLVAIKKSYHYHSSCYKQCMVFRNGNLRLYNDDDDFINLNVLQSGGTFSNTKTYARTTADPGLIQRAMDQINEGFPNTFCSASSPTQLIIATWIDYLKAGLNQGSNFQAIIATNGNNTFGIALYVDVSITSATTGIGSYVNDVDVPSDPSFFPFNTTVMDAPTMMLNSNIPGTYIFSLNAIPPDPCSSVCYSCKPRLVQLACEAMRINGEDVPASCNN
uniref:NIDO domain-containing protein n=1 Tax=Amphimedon queenslandica TaxID=400682 RepID=A0A1X7TUY0_AMPQE